MAISRADMLRINKLVPSSVELPEEAEESYQAGIEVFHQLHCLDMIRKMTYMEYYIVQPEYEWMSSPMQRIHTGIPLLSHLDFKPTTNLISTDHCIEMLRQKLMCDSDLHVYTYNWVDKANHGWPDFSTTQMCRNFDDVLRWGNEHHAYTSAIDGLLKKPENAEVLRLPSKAELGLELDK